MKAIFFNVIFWVILPFTDGKRQILEFGKEYKNLTTHGNLAPSLFIVPINGTIPPQAIRVVIMAPTVKSFNPLTITAMRRSSILSAVLPRIQTHHGQMFEYWFTADTLCDNTEKKSSQIDDAVRLAVASLSPAVFSLIVREVSNFNIPNNAVTVKSTPSEPVYFKYTFPTDVDRVAVQVQSISDICAQLMIREKRCPVFDTSGEIEKVGTFFFQTFSRHAYITAKKADIGEEFHIILSIKQDDVDCGYAKNMSENMYRIKKLDITVKPVSDGRISAIMPIFVYITVIVAVFLLSFIHIRSVVKNNNQPDILLIETEFEDTAPIVSHQEYEANSDTDHKNYYKFFIFMLIGNVVPSVAILFRRISDSYSPSNLDICNINFSCAIEFFGFPAFNNMVSASGMIVVGVFNLVLEYKFQIFRKVNLRKSSTKCGVSSQNSAKVVPMLSVIGLGLFWTLMHSCPRKFTFHLYNYAVIWLSLSTFMWIYSKRHNIGNWHPWYIIITATVLSLFTFHEKAFDNHNSYKLFENILLFVTANSFSVFFCFQYLYEKPSSINEYAWIRTPFSSELANMLPQEQKMCKPLESKKVFVFVFTIFNIVWTLTPFLSSYFNHTKCILRLVQIDLLIYLVFFIIQKIRLERSTFTKSYIIVVTTLFFIFVALVMFWMLIVFKFNTTFIAWTAAQSRTLNTSCIVPGIDWHDILHYDSAFICVAFILLIDHIDSNLKNVPKTAIYVF